LLSRAAIHSDWVALERNATLFRDPNNVSRRLVPVLVDQCELPASIGRFRYIDFRTAARRKNGMDELVVACTPVLRYSHNGNVLVVALPGRYSWESREVRAELGGLEAELASTEPPAVVVDLSATDVYSSSLAPVFQTIHKSCSRHDVKVAIAGATVLFREIWHCGWRFDDAFPDVAVFESLNEALDHCRVQ
jgi:anti-anti-sigma regulatory factor